ncbi:MAG: hypothetical protein CVU05_01945 [Bacteroidetes bacterium HGW-Bacteroidetes-21]|nr:MAG: hypothetical protein CVU05_01945 [Bacteroidetes bacterium HGW-Bacteroidetes-21]
MLNRIRKSKITKVVAVFIILTVFNDLVRPISLLALTSGPSQPEFQSFEPVGTTDMVNLFSGDFVYNIPLFELPGPDGGYPFNIAYHSGITMEQEASWVGLGWSLNPGAINRNVRNLPDEFNGEEITIVNGMKKNETYGGTIRGSLEIFGFEKEKSNVSLDVGLGLTPYYNNYKGFAITYDIGANAAMGLGNKSDNSPAIGLGLGLSMDKFQGVGTDASLTFQSHKRCKYTKYSIGAGYNSMEGLQSISLDCKSVRESGYTSRFRDYTQDNKTITSKGGTSTLSFTGGAFGTLNQQFEYRGLSLGVNFKLGLNNWGIDGSASIGGFYNVQKIKNNYEEVKYPTYGYLNLHNCYDEDYEHDKNNSIGDYAREKDNEIFKNTEYLPIPSLSYDVYSVVGQGIGNMYRPKRSDFGIITDRYKKSESNGYNIGAEIAPGNGMRWGSEGGYNHGCAKSGMWRNNFDSELVDYLKFHATCEDYPGYEPSYFKTYGEHSANDYKSLLQSSIYSELPCLVNIDNEDNDFDSDPIAQSQLRNKFSNAKEAIARKTRGKREKRGVSILPVLIGDIKKVVSPNVYAYDIISEIDLTRNVSDPNYSNQNALINDIRDKNSYHIAGFIATNTNGVKYVYGLPAYNNEHKEVQFSYYDESQDELTSRVSYSLNPEEDIESQLSEETNQYYSSTEFPKYPYAYLLTYVIGSDYVDIDEIPGPSDGDMGYWVKFNYERKENDYAWRAPYGQGTGNYMRGRNTDIRDDMVGYIEGEKEIWYLSSAETKTHKALFNLDANPREDGIGSGSGVQYKLNNIELYSKREMTTPIKTIAFDYDYSLCQGVENRATNGGKLSLKSIAIYYKDNLRGSFSPYRFSYSSGDGNPVYSSEGKYTDRWGNYNADNNAPTINPYVKQNANRTTNDAYAEAWELKKITLPSGGEISVDYESDDYAYVQDRVAMQMTEIVGVNEPEIYTIYTDQVNQPNYDYVYFKLNSPPSNTTVGGLKDLAKRYMSVGEYLYYKIRIKLKDNSQYEYIAGYAKVLDVSIILNSSSQEYVGRITLEKYKKPDENEYINYHPFAVAGWNHLKTNQPELLYNNLGAPSTDNETDAEKGNATVGFFEAIGDQYATIFRGLYDFCSHHNHMYCDRIYHDENTPESEYKSWVRLRNPDKMKMGGGSRVKKLVFDNKWSAGNLENNDVYGQVYEYKTTDIDGTEISSGVAEYEPLIGGDENPFRLPKPYYQLIPMKADNEFYAEEPFNESLFPGANVGYSKVTVSSLASYEYRDPSVSNKTTSPTGKTIYEFYTAKDFPVKVDNTELTFSQNNQTKFEKTTFIPLPFLGAITKYKFTGTQGYSIVLNDMHGKQRKVSTFNERGFLVNSAEYVYSTQVDDNSKLDNRLDVILSDKDLLDPSKAQIVKQDIGVEYDFVTDMRETYNFNMQSGVSFNSEIMLFPPLLAFYPWPNYNQTETQVRTIVTNKIIHKSGILTKVITNNGKSKTIVENKYFDPLTGSPLLTTTTNDFDGLIYDYKYPARWNYDGMGESSMNSGMAFQCSFTSLSDPLNPNLYRIDVNNPLVLNLLEPGDEFLLFEIPFSQNIGKAFYLGKRTDNSNNIYYIVYAESDMSNFIIAKIFNSGKKNILNSFSGSIIATSNPTINRSVNTSYSYFPLYPIINDYDVFKFDPVAVALAVEFFNYLWSNYKSEFLNDNSYEKTIDNSDLVLKSMYDALINEVTTEGSFCSSTVPPFLNVVKFGISMGYPSLLFKISSDRFVPLFVAHKYPYPCSISPIDNFPCTLNELEEISYGGPEINSFIINFQKTDNSVISKKYDSFFDDWGKNVPWENRPLYYIWNAQYFLDDQLKINNIISSNATEYSNQLCGSELNDAGIDNVHKYWMKNGWSVKSNNYYLDNRSQSFPVDIRNDGIIDNVDIFKWNKSGFNPTKWKKSNSLITVNRSNYPTELRDNNDVNTSMLYCLDGSYMSAIAYNANKNEIGFESFEEFSPGVTVNQTEYRSGNIDIYQNSSNYNKYTVYPIDAAKGNVAVVDLPYRNISGYEVVVDGETVDNEGKQLISGVGAVIDIALNGNTHYAVFNENIASDKTIVRFINSQGSIPGFVNNSDRLWKGSLRIKDEITGNLSNEGISIVNNQKHTGKNSLRVYNTTANFTQSRLLLKPTDTYVFSAWVKVNNCNVPSYSQLSNNVEVKINGATCQFKGKIIEGWQKVEVPFIALSNNIISIKSSNSNEVFIDDIRIHPYKSTMKSYVYNLQDYKLMAILDENNYSTLFFYDEEGKLYLKKQETERGIVTISESHSNLKPNDSN